MRSPYNLDFNILEKFSIHILGCGSALPTVKHLPTTQVVSLRNKLYMIDCGEGAQLQLRKSHLSFSNLSHIFISHLHGDHCFGLPGLISTFSLLGRKTPLHIYAPTPLKGLLNPWLNFFCKGMTFPVEIHSIDTEVTEKIYEDSALSVTTIPLSHRIPCCGFLFEEKPSLPHIRRDMIDYLEIPHFEINRIKQGGDWTTADGRYFRHEQLVIPANLPRSYAYCSDTAYLPNLKEQLKNVNLLFHETTFLQTDVQRAEETYHTTALQAATIARDSQVKSLLIGHFSARYPNEQILLEEAKNIFTNTQLATEGLVVEVV